jgi:DNA-binding transcriptional ArsR family regulator
MVRLPSNHEGRTVNDGPDIAAVAALIGDATRATVLAALVADRALSATELATLAGVAKPTISAHLEKLLAAGMVAVERQGRHKYFRLAGADVARLLESLMGFAARNAPSPPRSGPADPAVARARVCYDHLAGALGVELYERLSASGSLAPAGGDALELTAEGERRFAAAGIDVATLRGRRRPLCRRCLDWSERRHHLAGALGAALLAHALESRWARRDRRSRALHFSALGEAALLRTFGARPEARPTPASRDLAPALERLVAALSRRDVAAVERELADDVELLAEGDAALYGPRRPVGGRRRIAAALVALTRRAERVERIELTEIGGRPALVVERRPRPGFAARIALVARLDAVGRIAGLAAHLS